MVIPYLSFQGCCEEALQFYIRIFGGRVLFLSRWTEATGGPILSGKVMHMEAEISGSVLSGADQQDLPARGDAVRLMVHFDSAARALACCEGLAEGGELLQRLAPHPPPDDGGMGALVRDRYGYCWILTAPNETKRM